MRELVVVLLLAVPLAVLAAPATDNTDSPANPSSNSPSSVNPSDTSQSGKGLSGEGLSGESISGESPDIANVEIPDVASSESGESDEASYDESCGHEERYNLEFIKVTNSDSKELHVEDAYDLDFDACERRCCDLAKAAKAENSDNNRCNAVNLVVDEETKKPMCRLFSCLPDFRDCVWEERATFYAAHITLRSSEEVEESTEATDTVVPEISYDKPAEEGTGESSGDDLENLDLSDDTYDSELYKEEAEEAELEEIIEEMLDEYPDAEGYGSTPRPIDAGDVSDADANAGYGAAYLGSFTDSPIDKPALIIGCTATVLFVVIVLVCVGLKISNSQRSKYKPLRESTFNSNSVNQPLTGGYETYE